MSCFLFLQAHINIEFAEFHINTIISYVDFLSAGGNLFVTSAVRDGQVRRLYEYVRLVPLTYIGVTSPVLL